MRVLSWADDTLLILDSIFCGNDRWRRHSNTVPVLRRAWRLTLASVRFRTRNIGTAAGSSCPSGSNGESCVDPRMRNSSRRVLHAVRGERCAELAECTRPPRGPAWLHNLERRPALALAGGPKRQRYSTRSPYLRSSREAATSDRICFIGRKRRERERERERSREEVAVGASWSISGEPTHVPDATQCPGLFHALLLLFSSHLVRSTFRRLDVE